MGGGAEAGGGGGGRRHRGRGLRGAPAEGPGPAGGAKAVRCGDAASILSSMPDCSADLVVTSPPYFRQRSYGSMAGETGGEEDVSEYLCAVMAVFEQCARLVKDTGSIVFNMGDKYASGGSMMLVPYRFALEARQVGGIRLVNTITWLKTNPTPRQFLRRLVPSTEPFFHFAKSARYYYDLDAYGAELDRGRGAPRGGRRGTAGGAVQLPIDGAAPPAVARGAGNAARPARGRRAGTGKRYEALIDGSGLSASEKAAAKRALREAAADVRSGAIESFRMKIRGVHSPAFGGQEGGRNSQIANNGFTVIRLRGRPMRHDAIVSSVETIRGIGHPAVYPERIVRALIALLCPPGGMVVDPYMGSGTTGVAAVKTGRRYTGIDINPAYCRAARGRIAGESKAAR